MADKETSAAFIEDVLNNATEMDGKYLTFWMDRQLYGIPISDVVQIVSYQRITPVPEFPPYAPGIINLRGSVIPIIDMCLRLGKPEIEFDEHACMIVTGMGGNLVGLLVGSIHEVTYIPDDVICEPPRGIHEVSSTYLTGIGKREHGAILLLDAAKIVGTDLAGLTHHV